MNSEARWEPALLGEMTLVQLHCLQSKEPPGAAAALTSMGDFEEALARIEREEREWRGEG